MRGFLDAVTDLYRVAEPVSVLEVGCGEGQLALHMWQQGPRPDRFEICDVDLGRLHRGAADRYPRTAWQSGWTPSS